MRIIAALIWAMIAFTLATVIWLIDQVKTRKLSPRAYQIFPGRSHFVNYLAYLFTAFGLVWFAFFGMVFSLGAQ